ncbi:MAG: STAS domain-containing protein [Magnetococcales bacterium]|nr:STAS domain-containing protein [Magnetococcales bacterium]
MLLEVEKTKDKITIKPKGDFNYALNKDFQESFKNESPDLNYVVDMGRVTFIDSSGIGMLLILREHTGGRSDIQLINSSEAVRNALKLVHYDLLFQIV